MFYIFNFFASVHMTRPFHFVVWNNVTLDMIRSYRPNCFVLTDELKTVFSINATQPGRLAAIWM